MTTEAQNDANSTHASLDLLEVRLRRLEYLLSGSSSLDGVPDSVTKPASGDDAVLGRLRTLQAGLDRLRKNDGVAGEMVRDVETLYSHYPELKNSSASIPIEDVSTQASIVLANASLYPETASRLSSLQTLPIPPVETSSKLAGLSGDIDKCQHEQDNLDVTVQDLRQRSARCLEWWIKIGVVGMGDLWEEWEDRMVELERQVTRHERKRQDEEGYI
ncbi:uncharacterized protein HMPREF1541_05232 [Cyphellophora europaea CBS 101466]|uniref:Nuclear distribution protein RO10 n=1 Tax=Cyphellophora europaea (strain CBS 101466) TaxID=1220924 RepID=W2RX06_CYPE1|nr:uncharacterized protein HMPREF1541_05232 [Cyphellophora europaea CBS 101466]ETN40952.1 hypothetical protein HMPREF1541_05232 [Cyphellophora europaea CBS 101466]